MADPQVIKAMNELGRPLAEKLTSFAVEVQAASVQLGLLVPLLPADPSEVIDDGRASQGVTQITSGEAQAALALMQRFIEMLNDPDNASAIEAVWKMRVRPLRVE